MQRLLLLPILLCVFLSVQAQDEAIFVHYHINPILINPAFAGFNDTYQVQFNARAQWTGFEDSPKTIGARFNGPIGRSFGIGLGVVSEKAAQLSRTKLQLDYAFRFQIRDDWKMSAGFLTEFQRMDLNNDVMGNVFFQGGDELIDDLLNGKAQFDAGLGVFSSFGVEENTYAGLTFNNLVSSRLDGIAGVNTVNESFFSYYTFFVGHKAELTEQRITLEPSLLLRQIRETPFQMDINLKAGFLDDQIMAGLSYRSLGSLGLLLGAKVQTFQFYYSYDLSFQRFQQYNTGSHEVTVALAFKKKDPNQQRAQRQDR